MERSGNRSLNKNAMPLPLLPLIVGGAALASTATNALTGANANKKNRAFQEQMYERQKNDNLAQWNLQNNYNSPQEQMKRLQEAGLNPNLVYGSGGQTGGTAAPIPKADVGSYSHQPAQVDLAGPAAQSFMTHADLQIKNAQLDNLKAQNTDIINSAMLKAAQTMSTVSGGEKTQFQTQFLKDTAHITRAFMAEQANKMHYDQYQSQSAATTADEKNQLTLQKLKSEISNIQDSGKQTRLRNALLEIETDLRKQGFNPNDPIYIRMISRILSSQGLDITSPFK